MPLLKKAQARYDDNPSCTPPEQPLNVRLNLALAYQQTGHWREARQALAEALPLVPQATLRQRLWWHDLEAGAAMAESHPVRALRLYQELDEMAKGALSFEGRFRAALGRAQAHLALHQRTAALQALAAADRRIDEQTWNVPAHEGRDTLVAQRQEATRLYLSLLLAEGRRQDAFDLARRARSRLLRQLTVRDRLARLKPQEQGRWDRALASYQASRDTIDQEAAEEWKLLGDQKKRSLESRAAQLAKAREDLDRAMAGLGIPGTGGLSSPRPGEVILVYHPLPEGWVGFAADERGIELSKFDLPARELTDKALAKALLEPFRPVLERAERVRVLPYGRLQSVDFHTLPFGDEPLLARHLVVYGLDLPARPVANPPGRRIALLAADPLGNLPAARLEADTVAAAVRGWGQDWALKRLDGTAAQARPLREALPVAALFHYAGHGVYGGLAGWDSVLKLANGSRLTLGDLLALRQAPAWVVLSACEGGRSSDQAAGEGISLAHAFLLAGSQAVIAAIQDVPDRTARDLMSELYRGWQPGMDLPHQFQRAQKACLRSGRAADCASFRLFEP